MPDFQADLGMLDRVFNQAPGVKAETPADWQEQAMRQQAAQAVAQERRAKAQEAEQARADEALVRELAVKHQGDPDLIHAELMQVNPTFGAKFGKDVWDWRQSQAAGLKAQNANEWERHRRLMSKLEAAGDDPVAYTAVRAEILKADPEMASLLPESYDPVRVGNALQSAVDVDKIYARRNASVDMAAKGEWQQGLSGALDDPEVDTPEEHATVLQAWRTLGAPPAILAQFATFDPNPETRAARLRQMGLTPDQRADNARQAEAATATEAYRAARLAQGDAGLAISQQNANRLARQPAGGGARAAAGGGSDVAEFVDAYMAGDKDVLRGLTPTVATKVRAEILRRGGTLPAGASSTGKAPTGAERKVFGFFERLQQADEELALVEDEIAKLGTTGQLRLKAPDFFQTPLGRRYTQARRVFTEADMRRSSGAAISKGEYADADARLFIQPGDDEATKAQKRRTRARVLASTATESGGAFGEFFGDEADAILNTYRAKATPPKGTAGSGTTPAAKRAPQVGDVVTHQGKRYRVKSISGGNADLEPVP